MDGYLTKPIKSAELDAVLQIYANQNRRPGCVVPQSAKSSIL